MTDLAAEAEAAKAKLVAIGAQAGQAGVDAYKAAQSQIDTTKQAALSIAKGEGEKIGAGNVDFASLISTPSDRISAALAAEQASFKTARDTSTYGGLVHLGNVGALQHTIDAMAAANAGGGSGGGGGGSGGGGGGRGGGGSGGSTSDSELRVLLKGAAADTRNAQTQDAAQRVAAASKGRQVARKPVVQARQQVKAQQKQVRQLQKRIKNDDVRHPKHAQRRLANMREQLQASRADLRQAKKSRVSSVTKQRAAYSGLVGAGTQPLAPLATQIGIDAGEDPFRVQGLFDPVTASSLNTNDADELKRQGGLLATFGAPPKYGTYGAARKIGLAKQGMKGDKKVQAVRGGNLYRELTQNIEDDLAKNTPAATIIANISRATVPVYNKKGKQVGTEPLGKRHQNLVKLVMLDYAPALGAR